MQFRPDGLALWILFSTWCSASGWILSSLGCLDRAGYAVSLLVFAGGLILGRRHLFFSDTRPLFLFRWPLYARHLLPKLWAALTILTLVGGLLYHPDNYDYLTYRFPRLLHWSWEHHWHWIQTSNDRMNLSATGMEWLMAPSFILFQTDRLFFLINVISFLFLPGLVFSVFRHLGISGRIAWWWMWILPFGFCYALQSGSMGNDMFAAVYFLGSLHYLFQARTAHTTRNLVWSLLALALLTGAKASNVPLAAPWLVVALLNWKPLWAGGNFKVLVGAGLVGALVSFLPVALLNIHFTGDFSGDPANFHHVKLSNPIAGVVGNSIELAAGSLAPPVWPHAIDLEAKFPGVKQYLRHYFPRLEFNQGAFAIEENSGMGIGITAFTGLCLLYGLGRRFGPSKVRATRVAWWVGAGVAVAWLGYMAKMGSEGAPRLLAAYYAPAIAVILCILPLDGTVVHRRLWKLVAYVAIGMAFPLVILSPSRPLLPAGLIAKSLRTCGAPASAVAQLTDNYRLRASRFHGLKFLRQSIPKTETVVGEIMGVDDVSISLWQPFGSRKVVEVSPTDATSAQLEVGQIHYVVVSEAALKQNFKMSLDDLLKKWAMTVVQKENVVFKTQRKAETWYLLHSLNPDISLNRAAMSSFTVVQTVAPGDARLSE